MPFTPFHMGAGLLFKSLRPRYFSFILFGWTQILMDLQPLYAMLSGKGEIHGITHNIIGALVIAIISAFIFKRLSEDMHSIFRLIASSLISERCTLTNKTMSWRVALLSCLSGSYSHILFDSIMHSDAKPLYPFSSTNPLLHFYNLDMNLFMLYCACLGLVGLVLGFVYYIWQDLETLG